MALSASPHRRGRCPSTMTVAELIDRAPRPPAHQYEVVPVVTEPISVAALLRREGRGPRVADRPLVPRVRDREPPPPSRHSARKVAMVVCALFAAGTVLGSVGLQPVQRNIAGCDCGDSSDLPVPDNTSPLRRRVYEPPNHPIRVLLAAQTSPLTGQADDTAEDTASDGEDTTTTDAPPENPSGSALSRPAPRSSKTTVRSDRPRAKAATPTAATRVGQTAATADATVGLPSVRLPEVALPLADASAATTTRRVALSATDIRLPRSSTVSATTQDMRAETTEASVQAPDLHVPPAAVGPVELSTTEVDLPDVTIGKVEVSLPGQDELLRIEVPSVEVSRPRVRLPDLTVAGQPVLRTPDITLPTLRTPTITVDRSGVTISNGFLGSPKRAS